MPEIVYLAHFKFISTLSSYIIYFKIYLRMPKKLFSLLYTIYKFFIIILSKNSKI